MTGALAPRLVLVTRETEYEGLMARHATRGQVAAFLRRRSQTLTEVDAQRDQVGAMLAEIRAAVPKGWRIATVRRAELDRFLFGLEDVVFADGIEGDRLDFAWGRTLRVAVGERQLRFVPGARPLIPASPRRIVRPTQAVAAPTIQLAVPAPAARTRSAPRRSLIWLAQKIMTLIAAAV